jgi:hypothetical protein
MSLRFPMLCVGYLAPCSGACTAADVRSREQRWMKAGWTIPERQIDTSVVLADPKWWQLSSEGDASLARSNGQSF